MDPSVSKTTAAVYDPATHMRTPTGMVSGFHIDAFMTELRACTTRQQQIDLLQSFESYYHLNDGFWLHTTLMLHLDVDAPGFDGAADVGFTIDVHKDWRAPPQIGGTISSRDVPLECAPGHIIEVYGQWKTKIEEWLAGEKPCPLTRKREVQVPFNAPATMGTCPPLVNPYAGEQK